MPMILLLAAPAFADRVLWLTPPDQSSAAAVARTVPGATSAPLESLMNGGTAGLKLDAVATLRKELAEVRPLAAEFDGELQIMARLAKATDDVDVLRSEEERDLLQQALEFEGFAVQRYFQDKLATESAAAPYRTGSGADTWVTAWLDACSLLAAPGTPRAEDLPEPAQRLAFDDTQAHMRSMPSATFILGDLAAGAEVHVDGVKIEGGPGVHVRIVPGRHLFHVQVGDTLLLAQDVRIAAGNDAVVSAPFGPTELAELAGRLAAGGDGWEVPSDARVPIAGYKEPVYLATPGGEGTRLLRVDGGTASVVKIRPSEESTRGHLVARATIGGGWVSSGDFLVQNLDDGAAIDRYTVNAGAPAAALSAAYEAKWYSLGVGVDGQLALGEFHSLPTGDARTRLFLYPHVAAGLPWVQATVGPLFPWYLGVGAQARLPLFEPIELFAAGVYGVPLDQAREDDLPTFEPLPLYAAWGGVTVRLGG
jgi:hypothetical protein